MTRIDCRITTRGAGGRRAPRSCGRLAAALVALLVSCALIGALVPTGASAAPGKPTAKAPTGTITQVLPTFTWSKASGAARYEVRVSKGTELLLKKTGITKLSWKSGKALPRGVSLIWKVRASSARGTGPWSKSLSFRVAKSGPAIGDYYQGGKVAYIFQPGDPGYVAGQTHGLIAATADLSPVAWSSVLLDFVGTTQMGIGTGQANTAAIVAQAGCTGGAAYSCYYLSQGGYDDWYLPSIYELMKLYDNQFAIGGFGPQHYWSSSEQSFMFAWNLYFTNRFDDYNSKEYTYRVRPVRTF